MPSQDIDPIETQEWLDAFKSVARIGLIGKSKWGQGKVSGLQHRIVAGGDISLKPVAISHGDLTIEIKGEEDGAAGGGANRLYFVDKKTTLNDLVKSLNAFGATPEDLISIFQALKKNGALIGDIELI